VDIFTQMRWDNADWYTASPLAALSDDQLSEMARSAGMTVEEMRRYLSTPHVEMTCPLCGRPQTHLTSCKGCGGDAWGWDWQEAHGEDAADQVRGYLRASLSEADDAAGEQLQHASKHAYHLGGCMVCAECWRNVVVQPDANLTCPVALVAGRVLEAHAIPPGMFLAVIAAADRERAAGEWLEGIWARWTETWNTVPDGGEREAVTAWRAALLKAAFTVLPGGDDACVHPDEGSAQEM
jgi:hypothetical protein